MAFWNRGPKPTEVAPPPAPEAPNVEDVIETRMRDALETPGFMPFLKRVTESKGGSLKELDMSNENSKEILDRFEVFDKSSKVSREIKNTLKKELFAETHVQMSDEDLNCVDEYIQNEAIDRGPEGGPYLDDLSAKITHFKDNRDKIQTIDQEIADAQATFQERAKLFNQTLDMSSITRKIARPMSRLSRGLFMSGQASVLDSAEAKGIDPKNLREAREALDQDKTNLDGLRETQNRLLGSYYILMENIAGGSKLMDIVRQKVAEKLTGAMKGENVTVTSLDQAQQHFDNLSERYTDGWSEDFSHEMDDMIRDKIKEEAIQAVGRVTTDRKGHLKTMREGLHSLFVRRGLGSNKDPEEIKKFIGQTLAEICAKETDDIKIALINRVCAEHGLTLPKLNATQPPTDEAPAEEAETPAVDAVDPGAPLAPVPPVAEAPTVEVPAVAAQVAAPTAKGPAPAATAATERSTEPVDESWRTKESTALTLARGRKKIELGIGAPFSMLSPEQAAQIDVALTREDFDKEQAELDRKEAIRQGILDRRQAKPASAVPASETASPAAEVTAPEAAQASPDYVDPTDTSPVSQRPEPTGLPRPGQGDLDELPPSFQRAQARREANQQAQTNGPGNDTAESRLDEAAANMELKEMPDEAAANMELKEMPEGTPPDTGPKKPDPADLEDWTRPV